MASSDGRRTVKRSSLTGIVDTFQSREIGETQQTSSLSTKEFLRGCGGGHAFSQQLVAVQKTKKKQRRKVEGRRNLRLYLQ